MEEGLPVLGAPATGPVHDRYYKKFYAVDQTFGDQCILQHSNRICVVCLAPTHPLLSISSQEVVNVDFKIEMNNKALGKRKKVTTNSTVCIVHCKSGVSYCLKSCIKGSLIETNDQLLSKPTLLQIEPIGKGYIAILQPKLENAGSACAQLLTEEEYMEKR